MTETTTTKSTRQQSLNQRRAAHAWGCIERLYGTGNQPANNKDWEDYTGEAHKLPVRIMASGIGQALAFLHAKQSKKSALKQLLADLADWTLVQRPLNSSIEVPQQNTPDLLRAVIDCDTNFMRWATDEVIEWLGWLNRFAEGKGRTSTTQTHDD